MDSNVVVIGGGASGLAAAIAASRAGASVTIVERDKQMGAKILVTGNGRCNLSNTGIDPHAYNAPEFVASVLDRWGSAEVQGFFSELGLFTIEDGEGRVFPYSKEARSVLDVLLLECQHLKVKMMCDFAVIDIRPRSDTADFNPPFTLLSQSGTWINADTIILATGSDFSLIPFLGHGKVKPSPVLCPIATTLERIRGLSGVRVHCRATLRDEHGDVDSETGELLFRDYGISGIMVFDLSRYLAQGQTVSLDFFPECSLAELTAIIAQRSADLSWRKPADLLTGMLPPRVIAAVMQVASHDERNLAEILKDFELKVGGVGDARQAQVTRGGAKLDEVDPVTLASRNVAGLYLTGETLDVDGRCGGYNLHWAWASGLTAGEAAAKAVTHR